MAARGDQILELCRGSPWSYCYWDSGVPVSETPEGSTAEVMAAAV